MNSNIAQMKVALTEKRQHQASLQLKVKGLCRAIIPLVNPVLKPVEKMEKAQRVADDVVKEVKKAGLTSETADEIRRQILGIGA